MNYPIAIRCASAIVFTLVLVALFAPWQLQDASLAGLLQNKASSAVQSSSDATTYLLGVGRADITGPVVEINMMGYADTSQSGSGLRQRLYCRAFIVADPEIPRDRLVYLILDTQSGDTAVRDGILAGLKELGPEYENYNEQNVAVTGTHSHSGPGAWLNYLLPQITSKGFDKDSYQAIVTGSVRAIQRAHRSLTPGNLYVGAGVTDGISVNRSPFSYLRNPKAERAKYTTDTDVDMTVLKFEDATSGKMMGILTWLPVHGTSLYQNNTLITGDNKGVAAYLFEESMKQENPAFVAGFSQANVGDTSPNVLGAFCEDTGLACRFNDSTCAGRTQGCHGRGPFFQIQDQGTRSCFEIGKRQFDAAKAILDSQSMKRIDVSTVSSFHTHVDLSSYTFKSPFNSTRLLETCSAALGYGFAGGTTDGPGAFDFRQGTNDTDDDSPALKNPLWKVARGFVHPPTDEQIACQSPKPILLDVGAATSPYAWSPNIVNIQAMRVGSFLIVVVPGEATTMSGRRWREAVSAHAKEILDVADPVVVLGGPANTYAHYIATEEEYSVQRYEAASTLYGPHTLAAYVNLTLTYLPYLKESRSDLPPLAEGPQPPINTNKSLSFITGVVVDNPGLFRSFGQTLLSPDPAKHHRPGDVVSASFVGANPRNNFRLEETFAAVEQFDSASGSWNQIRSDRDWSLVYHWKRKSTVIGTSEVRIDWEIEEGGTFDSVQLYRIKYYGDAKSLIGGIEPFEGTSGTFLVGSTAATGSGLLNDELAR